MRRCRLLVPAILVAIGGVCGCGDDTPTTFRDGSQMADAAGGVGGIGGSLKADAASGAGGIGGSQKADAAGGAGGIDGSQKADAVDGAGEIDGSQKADAPGGAGGIDGSQKADATCLFSGSDGGSGTDAGRTDMVGSGLRITTDPPAGTVLSVGLQRTMSFTISSICVDAGGVDAGTIVLVQPFLAVSGSNPGQYVSTGDLVRSSTLGTVETNGTLTVTIALTPPRTATPYEWVLMSFWIVPPGTVLSKPLDEGNPNQWLVYPVQP